jgi:alpha-L-fucosidase
MWGLKSDMVYFDSRANIIEERFKHKLLEHYINRPDARSDTVVSYKQADFPDDVGLLDIECGRFLDVQSFEWQTDDRLEAKRTWCHVEEPAYKSAGEIIRQLCDVVSKNGNLLLNVGPKTDGTFPDEAKSVLYEVGDWLSLYGEAIYETRPFNVYGEGATEVKDTNFDINQIEEQTRKGVFEEDFKDGLSAEDIRFTTKGNLLYAITMGSSDKNQVEIASLADGAGLSSKQISRIDMIGGAEDLEWSRNASVLTVMLKGEMPSPHANVLKIVYEEV